MCFRHHPIHCIIPPYMLDEAMERGDEQVRSAMLRLTKQSNHFRLQRSLIYERLQSLQEELRSGTEAHSAELVRRVYDAENTETLPGVLVRREGEPPTGDLVVDEAYDGAGATWRLYQEEYGRNSIDDRGIIIDQTVHYGDRFNNAFWNGEQMVYGDGDLRLFSRFTSDIDIIAHELTHGVTQYEAKLVYFYQSGALNESFSDVFGILVKQRELGQEARESDWLIGANVLVGDQYALRSMKAPGTAYVNHPVIGTDPQPATMDDYKTLPPWEDNGGVHINSGIPNFAFYVTAIELGGKAWETAGMIWYRALADRLGRISTFRRAARATIDIAREEFGAGSLAVKAVQKGWREAKVI
ncbi:MAG: M4 family metallopeptidase [Synechococcales bacterium]|nr:M4 family metallopeptidase [Synechococcales bacterium]